MRMARVNVYLPDDLAEAARKSGLNVSALTQEAIRNEIEGASVDNWLASLASIPPVTVSSATVRRALDEAKDELWGDA